METKGRQIIACQNLVNAEHLVPGYKVEIRDNRRWLPAVIVVSVCSARPVLPSALPPARWLNLTDVAALHAIRPNQRGKTNKGMKSVSCSLSLRRLKSARSRPPAPRVVVVVNHPIPPRRVASSHTSHALNHNVRPLRLETSRANDASVRPRRRRSAFVRRRSNLGSTERRRARHASRHLYQSRLNVKRACLQSKAVACGCSPSRRRRVSRAVRVELFLSTFSHSA